jgi:hypothetical protein
LVSGPSSRMTRWFSVTVRVRLAVAWVGGLHPVAGFDVMSLMAFFLS